MVILKTNTLKQIAFLYNSKQQWRKYIPIIIKIGSIKLQGKKSNQKGTESVGKKIMKIC